LQNAVASDILGISWDYDDAEGFEVAPDLAIELRAKAEIDSSAILATGNELVWKASKKDPSAPESCKVEEKDGKYYLYAVAEGESVITCQNRRGTVSRSFLAVAFEDGAMVINPVRKASGQSILDTPVYGLYDLSYDGIALDAYEKVPSSFALQTKAFAAGGGFSTDAILDNCSDNVSYQDGVVSILAPGESYVTLLEPSLGVRGTYRFEVKDAVNVYSYDDLLMATNFSSQGEEVVLRASLESLKTVYVPIKEGDKVVGYKDEFLPGKEGSEIFGHYDFEAQRFAFESEAYAFESDFSTDYIDWYNGRPAVKENPSLALSKTLLAGIRLQKNLYGNGYSINMNGLCFPNHGTYPKEGKGKLVPTKGEDYFFGPLPTYVVGDPAATPLVSTLGQDNVGLLLDGDAISVSDLYVQNADPVSNFYDLTYCGTVIDVMGKDCSVSSSVISYGKVGVRAFDAENFLLDNCIVRHSLEFHLLLGTNSRRPIDENKAVSVSMQDGKAVSGTASSFLEGGSESGADAYLGAFLQAGMDGNVAAKKQDGSYVYDYGEDLRAIQGVLDEDPGNAPAFEATVKDTLFGRSGIFSIAFESAFNGPLLRGDIPSLMSGMLTMLGDLAPKMGRTSVPVSLTLVGDTRFYDWKDLDAIDMSALIDENISAILNSIGYGDKVVTIDDIFPIKRALGSLAKQKGQIFEKDGKRYLNTALAYYGGGLNLSKATGYADGAYNTYGPELSIDLVKDAIEYCPGGLSSLMENAVLMAIGTHPFRFVINGAQEGKNPLLSLDAAPAIETLKQHIQGGTAS
ncbi:MAG: hypothetical protein ACI4UT_01695, partial [Candidatus Enteromonas sp.]